MDTVQGKQETLLSDEKSKEEVFRERVNVSKTPLISDTITLMERINVRY